MKATLLHQFRSSLDVTNVFRRMAQDGKSGFGKISKLDRFLAQDFVFAAVPVLLSKSKRFLGMLKILIVFGVFLAGAPQVHAQGPGASWPYYRPISLSPVTPATNFQVKVTLTSGQYTNMKTDGSDLRFYSNLDVNCEYWIETWNTGGTSTIWVKIPNSGASSLFLYYGNASATAASNGAAVFDFFDDFTTALGSNWTTVTSGGSVSQSGTNVTLSNTNGGTVSLSNTSAFAPASSSFLLETKHREVGYNRNRFYATTSAGAGCPAGLTPTDYGYFSTSATAQASAQVYWGSYPGSTSLSNNTDYLTRWQITDGSTYNWYTLNYASGAAVSNGSRTTTYGSNIRYISILVTEVASTSTIIDWIRLRQYTATEPVTTVLDPSVSPATFSSSGSFIVPLGVTSVTVECWGGGGKGGARASSTGACGGGGGGAYSYMVVSVTPGSTYTYTVGAGSTSTSAGGDSYFINTSTILAKGGSSVANNSATGVAGGLASAGVGLPKFDGGTGGTGTGTNGGGGGSSAGTGAIGGTGGVPAGGTAPTGGGAGGAGRSGTTGVGNPGFTPGGAGGGAYRSLSGNSAGGNGANGQVIITWTTCATPTAFNVTGTGSYCSGGTGVAVGLAGSESGVTYQLYIGGSTPDGTPVSGTGSAISFGNKTAAGTYTVVATRTAGGCTNNMTGSAVVTVIPVVIPSVSIGASPGSTICAGTSVTFTATPTNGGSTPSYQWKLNGGDVGTNSATYINAALVNSDQVSCVMTSNAPCASPTTATSNTITMVVNPLPTITLGSNPSICRGTTLADLSYSATSGSPDKYSIDYDGTANGAGFVDVTNASLPSTPIVLVVPSGAAAAVYNGTLTVRNSTTGCVSGSYSIQVTIIALPTITLGSNPAVCGGTTTADLAYSATTESPDIYSIDYDT
ncbi:MAG: DUF2341 domain-containing protein, partial [Bacteroidia bacterium]|nr:DUF2341 domain-containing protein [Bacteroidia bacterium]